MQRQRQLLVELSAVDLNKIVVRFMNEGQRIMEVLASDRDQPLLDTSKEAKSKVLRNLKSIAQLKVNKGTQEHFNTVRDSTMMSHRRSVSSLSSDLSGDNGKKNDTNSQSHASDENSLYYVLDVVKSCLENNKEVLHLVREDFVQFLLDALFSAHEGVAKERMDFVEIEASACLALITEATDKFERLLCSWLGETWKSRVPVGYSVNDHPEVGLGFLLRISEITFHPAKTDYCLLLLENVWQTVSNADRSQVRIQICDCFSSLLSKMCADKYSGDTQQILSKPWITFLGSASTVRLQATNLLGSIHSKILKWIKRDKHTLVVSILNLALMAIVMQGDAYLLQHIESWMDLSIKFMKPEGGLEREMSLRLIDRMLTCLSPEFIAANQEKVVKLLELLVSSVIQLVRRRNGLNAVENALFLAASSHLCKHSKSTLVSLLEFLVGDQCKGVEYKLFALQLMEDNISAVSTFRLKEDDLVQFCFSILESLGDKDLVRAVLPVIPHLWNGDEKRMQKVLYTYNRPCLFCL
jgi:hypothetical protein